MDVQAPQQIVYPPLSFSAVSTDPAMEIQYFGSQKFASVQVASSDMLFKVGTASPGSADANMTSLATAEAAGTSGTIDLTTPSVTVDSFGELHDFINRMRDWRCRLLGVRRADKTDSVLATLAATQCNVVPVSIFRNTTASVQSNTFTMGLRVTPRILAGPGSGGWINRITDISGVVTFAAPGTGAGYNDGEGTTLNDCRIIVYSINDIINPGITVTDAVYRRNQRRVWSSGPLTSAVAFQFDSADWQFQDLSSDPGEELLVLIQNSGTGAVTLTSPSLTINGYREQTGGAGRIERWHLSRN